MPGFQDIAMPTRGIKEIAQSSKHARKALPLARGVDLADIWSFGWSGIFAWPEIISSDNGSHFANEGSKTLLDLYGTKMRFGPAYHPQTSGLMERNPVSASNIQINTSCSLLSLRPGLKAQGMASAGFSPAP
ncbi:hypothetical protein GGTG_09110 [Gaeumannomyces tritici R3-111a-1]|uniref:Integrase catalytic domain-containing protein n=1 Tax=Gaeumannomyces tritici (strain R3-111a-1) TaxID=644352 RepID=J3P6H0_GAET3|nr:hypothetical protein GGTG_09110 [Gaeumannomyces tritici R3-111a-1]EJT72244.1 hypothetical protein GGTG_09110 [Gaeumannomyces tritici R3-111a-1]